MDSLKLYTFHVEYFFFSSLYFLHSIFVNALPANGFLILFTLIIVYNCVTVEMFRNLHGMLAITYQLTKVMTLMLTRES